MIQRIRIAMVTALCSLLTLGAQADDAHWTVSAHDYEYDMTAYVALTDDGTAVTNYDGYEVAAFCGNECRGVTAWRTVEDHTYGYLRIRSNQNEGETITFKVYVKALQTEVSTDFSLTFKALDVVGLPSSPQVLNFIKDETDKVAFDAYKIEQEAAADALAEEGDSEASQQLIADAKAAIDALSYDESKTLDENKAIIDAIIDQLNADLAAQREADAAAAQLAADNAAFETSTTAQEAAADALAEDGDSEASQQLIADAKAAIDALSYDETKTLDENKAIVDAIIDQLNADLTAQREADAAAAQLAADKAAFDTYKTEQEGAADALAEDGDSEASQQLITDAKAAIDALNYDESKTLDENKAVVDAIIDQLNADLTAQREADAAAAQLAADKAAFDTYKTEQEAAAGALAEDGDSEASQQLIADAKAAIDALSYDESKTLDENKAIVDAIIDQLEDDLAAQRESETVNIASIKPLNAGNVTVYDMNGRKVQTDKLQKGHVYIINGKKMILR